MNTPAEATEGAEPVEARKVPVCARCGAPVDRGMVVQSSRLCRLCHADQKAFPKRVTAPAHNVPASPARHVKEQQEALFKPGPSFGETACWTFAIIGQGLLFFGAVRAETMGDLALTICNQGLVLVLFAGAIILTLRRKARYGESETKGGSRR